MQLLRPIFSGVFDRNPDLQVIVGQWGEVVLFYVERIATMQQMDLKLELPLEDHFRENVFYTPQWMLSERYLQWTLDVVGGDRLMYAVDYPYIQPPDNAARGFLEQADMEQADREKIAHGSWERLTDR